MHLSFSDRCFGRFVNRLAALHARPPLVTTLSESTRLRLHRPKEQDLSSPDQSLSGAARRPKEIALLQNFVNDMIDLTFRVRYFRAP